MLGLQGLDPAKFAAFNVLEDQDLRAGLLDLFFFFSPFSDFGDGLC